MKRSINTPPRRGWNYHRFLRYFAGTYYCLRLGRGTVTVKCLAKELIKRTWLNLKRSNVQLSVESLQALLLLNLTLLCTWSRKLTLPSQPIKLKPISTWSFTFSCASGGFLVVTLSFHRVNLSSSGCWDYFGFLNLQYWKFRVSIYNLYWLALETNNAKFISTWGY